MVNDSMTETPRTAATALRRWYETGFDSLEKRLNGGAQGPIHQLR